MTVSAKMATNGLLQGITLTPTPTPIDVVVVVKRGRRKIGVDFNLPDDLDDNGRKEINRQLVTSGIPLVVSEDNIVTHTRTGMVKSGDESAPEQEKHWWVTPTPPAKTR